MSRSHRHSSPLSGSFPGLVTLAVLGLTAWYVFRPTADVAPGRLELARLSHRRVQNTVALNGIAGGATAGQREIAENDPTAPPPDRLAVRVSAATAYGSTPHPDVCVARSDPQDPPPAVRVSGVTSRPYRNPTEAHDDALRAARDTLVEVFASLRPPIRVVPDEEELKNEYLEGESVIRLPLTDGEKVALKDAGLEQEMVRVRLAVSMSEAQLRELRARQRLYDLSRWAVAALAVLAIAYGLLRAEASSQGYFTWLWAGIGAALVGGVVTLALVL